MDGNYVVLNFKEAVMKIKVSGNEIKCVLRDEVKN